MSFWWLEFTLQLNGVMLRDVSTNLVSLIHINGLDQILQTSLIVDLMWPAQLVLAYTAYKKLNTLLRDNLRTTNTEIGCKKMKVNADLVKI